MNIDNADGKYEISDFGRVLTILRAESENEGKYTCKHSGKNETVFLNVTCKIFVKIYIFNLLKKMACMILHTSIKTILVQRLVCTARLLIGIYSCSLSKREQSDARFGGTRRTDGHVPL